MTKKARFWHLVKKHKVLYLLMLPGILYYVIFKYVPMYGIIIAFQDFSIGKGILGSKFVGLKHFIEFFYVTPDSWKLIRNTIMLNVYDLLFHFPSPIILAILFHEPAQQMVQRVCPKCQLYASLSLYRRHRGNSRYLFVADDRGG